MAGRGRGRGYRERSISPPQRGSPDYGRYGPGPGRGFGAPRGRRDDRDDFRSGPDDRGRPPYRGAGGYDRGPGGPPPSGRGGFPRDARDGFGRHDSYREQFDRDRDRDIDRDGYGRDAMRGGSPDYMGGHGHAGGAHGDYHRGGGPNRAGSPGDANAPPLSKVMFIKHRIPAEDLSDKEVDRRYTEYLATKLRSKNRAIFEVHKYDDLFVRKYDPFMIQADVQKRTKLAQTTAHTFASAMAEGKYDWTDSGKQQLLLPSEYKKAVATKIPTPVISWLPEVVSICWKIAARLLTKLNAEKDIKFSADVGDVFPWVSAATADPPAAGGGGDVDNGKVPEREEEGKDGKEEGGGGGGGEGEKEKAAGEDGNQADAAGEQSRGEGDDQDDAEKAKENEGEGEAGGATEGGGVDGAAGDAEAGKEEAKDTEMDTSGGGREAEGDAPADCEAAPSKKPAGDNAKAGAAVAAGRGEDDLLKPEPLDEEELATRTGQLDVMLEFLWQVHGLDFYSGESGELAVDLYMTVKDCLKRHPPDVEYRAVRIAKPQNATLVDDRKREALIEEFHHNVSKPWMERLKRVDADTQRAADLDAQLEAAVAVAITKMLSDARQEERTGTQVSYKCPFEHYNCTKKFKGEEFLRKHIQNRHEGPFTEFKTSERAKAREQLFFENFENISKDEPARHPGQLGPDDGGAHPDGGAGGHPHMPPMGMYGMPMAAHPAFMNPAALMYGMMGPAGMAVNPAMMMDGLGHFMGGHHGGPGGGGGRSRGRGRRGRHHQTYYDFDAPGNAREPLNYGDI